MAIEFSNLAMEPDMELFIVSNVIRAIDAKVHQHYYAKHRAHGRLHHQHAKVSIIIYID